jgi:proline dehydrogenase
MKKTEVSKYMQELAKKFNLDVTATIEKGDYNSTYKVYHFSGNFLANFEALVREAEGYTKSTEFPAALVKN